jgi:hypothetical protein
MTPTKRKELLKEKFGDNYLAFMQDLSNVSLSHREIGEKWGVCRGVVSRYVTELGYVHSGKIKMQIRNAYRVQERVRHRQETARQLMSVLMRRSK